MLRLVLLVLMATASSASQAGSLRLSMPPPAKYASGDPIAPVETFALPLGEVNAICRDHIVFDKAAFAEVPIDACVVFSSDVTFVRWDERDTATSCVIFYAEDGFPSKEEYDAMIIHETAHCRGWPPDHPAY